MRKEFKAVVLYPATKSILRISKYSFKHLAFGQTLLGVVFFLIHLVCLYLFVCQSSWYLCHVGKSAVIFR